MEVMNMTFDKNFEIKKIDDEGIVWHNVKLTDVVKLYGLNWLEENKDFYRLPLAKKPELEPICPNVVRLAISMWKLLLMKTYRE
jgi:hypothetical protein